MHDKPMRFWSTAALVCCLALATSSCGNGERVATLEEYNTRAITLPDGTLVRAEAVMKPVDMAKGMMFRDSLPEGKGMLFIHGRADKYPYWMYQTKIPLDIIWLDKAGRVVELSEDTPPCEKQASQCPNYGGSVASSVVLELPGGYSRKHGVQHGSFISF